MENRMAQCFPRNHGFQGTCCLLLAIFEGKADPSCREDRILYQVEEFVGASLAFGWIFLGAHGLA